MRSDFHFNSIIKGFLCNASEVDGTDGCLIECGEGEIVNIDLPAGEWSCGEDDGRCPGSLALGCDGDATTSTVPPPDTDCEEVCRGAAEGQQVGLLVIFASLSKNVSFNCRYSGAAAAATSACALRWPATTWTAPPTRGSAPTSRTASGRTSAGATWTPAAVGDNDGLMIVDNISGQWPKCT